MVRPPAVAAAPSPSHCRRAAPISSAVVLSKEEVAKAAWLAKQDLPLWGPAARRSSVAPRRALGSGRHSAASYLYSTMLKPKAKVRCDVADVRETRNWRAVEEAAIARRASLSLETSETALLDTVRSARWSWGGVWNGCRGVHVVVSVRVRVRVRVLTLILTLALTLTLTLTLALTLTPISQAEARQRRGRAGRVRSGRCCHLYCPLP